MRQQPTIGERVRAARLRAGLTSSELAKKAGLSQIRMIECGYRGGLPSLQRIAKALGISIGQLLDWPVKASRKKKIKS